MKELKIRLTDSQHADIEAIASHYGTTPANLVLGAAIASIEGDIQSSKEDEMKATVETWTGWATNGAPMEVRGHRSGPFKEEASEQAREGDSKVVNFQMTYKRFKALKRQLEG